MKQKENISKFRNCYGCGVCVISCPVDIISIELNSKGFYKPVIHHQDKCIECGACLDVCAYNHSEVASAPAPTMVRAYACHSRSLDSRLASTTGATGYEIAAEAAGRGEKVCGVRYNIPLARAEHFTTSDGEELNPSRGTKYIPSFTADGLKALGRKEPFTFFGLPCQVDSMRRYVRRFRIEDKATLVDLLCYGVPSLTLWHRWLKEYCGDAGRIESVKFRSKRFGWHDSACIEVEGSGGSVIQKAGSSPFFGLFFRDSCLNDCCYDKCKYKLIASSADMRIGDFWGEKYAGDRAGVNVVFTLTPRGEQLLESLRQRCHIEQATLEEATARQKHTNAAPSPFRPLVMWGLRIGLPLGLLDNIVKYGRLLFSPAKQFKRIKAKYSKK